MKVLLGMTIIVSLLILGSIVEVSSQGRNPPFNKSHSGGLNLTVSCSADQVIGACPCRSDKLAVSWEISDYGNKTRNTGWADYKGYATIGSCEIALTKGVVTQKYPFG